MLLLGHFLRLAASETASSSSRLRIIEAGAGTGGTTKYIVAFLREHGVAFDYTFTDISGSLVAAARHGTFAHEADMEFAVLDIEGSNISGALAGKFDVVITSSCVHATRDLVVSLSNVRGLLGPRETTRTMCWLDMISGFFAGWRAFEDGRQHALVDEVRWKQCMLDAGFSSVDWSCGEAVEAGLVKLIVGFHGTD